MACGRVVRCSLNQSSILAMVRRLKTAKAAEKAKNSIIARKPPCRVRLQSLFQALPQSDPIRKMKKIKVMATQIHVAMLEAPIAKRKTNSKRSMKVIMAGKLVEGWQKV